VQQIEACNLVEAGLRTKGQIARNLSLFVMAAVFGCFLCSEATACRGATNLIFFDDVPEAFFDDAHRGVKVLVAADVTLVGVAPPILDLRDPRAAFQIGTRESRS
jgi:hypothetical protein